MRGGMLVRSRPYVLDIRTDRSTSPGQHSGGDRKCRDRFDIRENLCLAKLVRSSDVQLGRRKQCLG